jgi:YVTN family beta-propeller protein
VLDAATLDTNFTIAVGEMPAEVTFDLNGTRAFVANGMSHDVTVINVATKAVMTTLPVCEGPVGAWTGGDGVMYTDCEQGQALAAIDAQSLTEIRRYALGFMPGMAATPPGVAGEVWVTNSDDGRVAFYSTSSDTSSGDLMTGAGAHGVGFSADGSTAFITNQAANSLSVIDVVGKAVRATVALGQKPNGLVFRPR